MDRNSPEYQAYQAYLLSPKWAKKRKAALKRAGYKCQYCGASGVLLQVHHLTYARLGKEKQADLRVTCETCHEKADEVRRFEAGLQTYSVKRWGENWQDKPGREAAEKEFKSWILTKKDAGGAMRRQAG